MKKTLISFILFFCFATLLLAAKPKPIATLTKFFGEVYIKAKTQTEWQLVRKGQLFYEGDRVKSEETGKAIIYFSNGSQIILSPESELEFNPISPKQKKKRSIFMRKGKSFNKVVHGSQYEVESIYAIAAVKGTEFDFEQTEEGTQIHVGDGVVNVKNKKTGEDQDAKKDDKITETKTGTEVTQESFPEVDKLRSEYDLSGAISGSPRSEEMFEVSFYIKDKSGNLITEEKEISIYSNSTDLSLLDGTKLVDKVSKKSEDGRYTIMGIARAEGQRKTVSLTAITDNIESLTLDISILPSFSEKQIIINLKDYNGKPHTLKLKYKKKEL